jgi:hypothetical protein cresD4_05762
LSNLDKRRSLFFTISLAVLVVLMLFLEWWLISALFDDNKPHIFVPFGFVSSVVLGTVAGTVFKKKLLKPSV